MTLKILLWVIILWSAFYAIYRHLFRPILLMRLRYVTFACRDELRRLAMNGALNEKDDVYVMLERACYAALSILENANLLDLIFHKLDMEGKLRAQRDRKVIEEAKPEVRSIWTNLIMTMLGGMSMNSPGLLVLFLPVGMAVVFTAWFGKLKKFFDKWLIITWSLIYIPTRRTRLAG